MCRKILLTILCGLMIFAPAAQTALAQTKAEEKIRHRVVELGTNKSVSVKLKSGEKITGRIAEIRDDAIAVQSVENGKILTREIQWATIDKISERNSAEKMRKIGGFIALGAAMMLVTIIIVGLSQTD